MGRWEERVILGKAETLKTEKLREEVEDVETLRS
jgi:hypothetical protein